MIPIFRLGAVQVLEAVGLPGVCKLVGRLVLHPIRALLDGTGGQPTAAERVEGRGLSGLGGSNWLVWLLDCWLLAGGIVGIC